MKAPLAGDIPRPLPPSGSPVRIEIPGYTLESLLGAGSYGAVYLARADKNGQTVAIKIAHVHDDARRIERFRRETSLCSRLRHPSIVQLLDDGVCGQYVYGVFEYVPGVTLKQRLLQEGPLDPLETGRLMSQVLDALACAHQLGIVHRDLKPENIMIARYGVVNHAKVLDFGISTVVPDLREPHFKNMTLADECLGTPTYCAPEQLRGENPSVQADLYAWALVFIECLTGRPVFEGVSAADIFYQKLVPQETVLPKSIGLHPVATLLRKALRKKRVERHASAGDMLLELSRIRLDDLVGVSLPQAAAERAAELPTTICQPSREEKRQVTILCCSVSVCQPDAGDGLDSDGFEQRESLQRTLCQAFQEAALMRGGTLIGSLGHQFSVMFGYPRSTEGDARLAASMAVELALLARERQGDAALRRAGAELEVRIGLHAGMVVAVDGEVSPGNTLNIALQMESHAGPGEVWASEAYRQLLRGLAEFEPAGRMRVPSASATVGCFKLLTHTLQPIEIAAGSDSWHTRCIGRARELRQVLRGWRRARLGQGGGWLLRGEAGVGKSCLSETLRRHIASRGGLTLCARCFPEYENNALSPLLSLLRQHVLAGVEPVAQIARLTQVLHDAGCDVDRVMPIFCAWLALPFARQDAGAVSPVLQKQLLIEALGQWLGHLAQHTPVLLMVEDLHWADSATLDALHHVAHQLPGQALALLMTCRPGAGLEAESVRTLELARLKPNEAAAMVRHQFAPRLLADSVVDSIVARTEGVPLFIQELSHVLRDTSLVETDGVWSFKPGAQVRAIPITLRESLHSRFDQLGPARDILQLAATIGREVDGGLLRVCAAEAGPDALALALDILVDAGLLARADDDRYVFRHALIRDAAYDIMLISQQRRRHEVVAQAIVEHDPQQLSDAPGSVAHHFARAEHYPRAVELGLAQLRLTQHRSLNDETIAYADQVNEWINRLEGRAQLEARLELNGCVTQALMNKYGWAHPQVAEKIALSESILAQDISAELRLQHLWTTLTFHHVASNRADVMQLAQAMLQHGQARDDSHALVSARLWLGLAQYSEGRFDDAERELSAAIDAHDHEAHAGHAVRFGLDTLVWSRAARALVRWGLGYEQSARDDARVAVARARQLAHAPSLGIALLYLGLFELGRDDATAAQAVCDELIELAHRYGLPAFLGYAQIIRSWAVGDTAHADAGIQALWSIGCRYCQTYYRAFAGHTLARAGDLAGALVRLDDSLSLVEPLAERLHESELYWHKARYLRASGAEASQVRAAAAAAADSARAGGKCRTEALALMLLTDIELDEALLARYRHRLHILKTQRPELSFF